ncbi:MAG: carbonic anhydrase [Bacteroidetes bacterium]|nr:carbonic anhydrase [Bacteroidota bacterium]
MESFIKLLLNNKLWAAEKVSQNPNYFQNLAKTQTPETLWIGCSDSRVPANEVIGAQPGEVFVHRNVANLVVHTDINMLSVLQFAVEELKVKDVIVCGHYGCGGVKASLGHKHLGILNKWLRNIKDVYRLHEVEFAGNLTEEQRVNKLVELNVKEQVTNLAKTSIIQKAWKYTDGPHLHGWVYGLEDGILKQVFDMPPGTAIDPIYVYEDL